MRENENGVMGDGVKNMLNTISGIYTTNNSKVLVVTRKSR